MFHKVYKDDFKFKRNQVKDPEHRKTELVF